MILNMFKMILSALIDTGENVQKWTRVFSTRRWVKLVARTRREKKEKTIVASTFWRFRLWTSFESSLVSVNSGAAGCYENETVRFLIIFQQIEF